MIFYTHKFNYIHSYYFHSESKMIRFNLLRIERNNVVRAFLDLSCANLKQWWEFYEFLALYQHVLDCFYVYLASISDSSFKNYLYGDNVSTTLTNDSDFRVVKKIHSLSNYWSYCYSAFPIECNRYLLESTFIRTNRSPYYNVENRAVCFFFQLRVHSLEIKKI